MRISFLKLTSQLKTIWSHCNRKKINFLILGFIVSLQVLTFQNCAEGFTSISSSLSPNAASSLPPLASGSTAPGFFAFPFSYAQTSIKLSAGSNFNQSPFFSSVDVYAFSYKIDPQLPAGLNFDTSNGVITGAATTTTPDITYTITATTNKGIGTATFNLSVVEVAPTIRFPGDAVNFYVGNSNLAVTPVVTGSFQNHFSVSPALPAGLGINPSTGVIAGTPGQLTSPQVYTVTVTNSVGSAQADLQIGVLLEPNSPFYAFSKIVVKVGNSVSDPLVLPTALSNLSLHFVSVSPSLPSALGFGFNGALSGIPTDVLGETIYSVIMQDGQNNSYNLSVDVTVVNQMPSLAPIAGNILTANQNNNFDWRPTSLTGKINSFSITPNLPAGLSLSAETGEIYGVPTVLVPATSFTLTGRNELGSTSITFNLIVLPALPDVDFHFGTFVINQGSTIDPVTPSARSTSGDMNWFAADSPLPAGLSLNNLTGEITGAPTQAVVKQNIRIVASGSSGFQLHTLTFDVWPNLGKIQSQFGFAVNMTGGSFSLGNLMYGPQLEPLIPTVNHEGEVAQADQWGQFLVTTTGSLYIYQNDSIPFLLVPNYLRNVVKFVECDTLVYCVLKKDGTTSVLKAQGLPTAAVQFGNYTDLPTTAVDISTSFASYLCFVLNDGSMLCHTGIGQESSSNPMKSVKVASIANAKNFVTATPCVQLKDNSVACFNNGFNPTAIPTMQTQGPKVLTVSDEYNNSFACTLTGDALGCTATVYSSIKGTWVSLTVPTIPALSSGVVDFAIDTTNMRDDVCGLSSTGDVSCFSMMVLHADQMGVLGDPQPLDLGIHSRVASIAASGNYFYANTMAGGQKATSTVVLQSSGTDQGWYIAP